MAVKTWWHRALLCWIYIRHHDDLRHALGAGKLKITQGRLICCETSAFISFAKESMLLRFQLWQIISYTFIIVLVCWSATHKWPIEKTQACSELNFDSLCNCRKPLLLNACPMDSLDSSLAASNICYSKGCVCVFPTMLWSSEDIIPSTFLLEVKICSCHSI